MFKLSCIDIVIIVVFLTSVVAIGAAAARRASRSATDYFLSGRTMPWWLLGISMVACTFSCGTPNLITDIVRNDGVAGNWVWWAFLLTGMLTVFVYAALWRRSGLNTDLGFYELRYSGRPAAFLRGFRAVYLGVVYNLIILGGFSLAAIKIGQVVFGLSGCKHPRLGGNRRRHLRDAGRADRIDLGGLLSVCHRHGRIGCGGNVCGQWRISAVRG
jgi:Na+/proline symporter